jgi:hypothetical protein
MIRPSRRDVCDINHDLGNSPGGGIGDAGLSARARGADPAEVDALDVAAADCETVVS